MRDAAWLISRKERWTPLVYLQYFVFPSAEVEFDFFMNEKRTCFNSFYPFQVLSRRGFERIDFEPITILYGGNGSGKTTALNIIAEKTRIKRVSLFNQSNYFPDYLDLCQVQYAGDLPDASQIITSDDVFDYMLNIRALNQGLDIKREELFTEYRKAKYSQFQMKSLEDYEQLRKVNRARSNSQSRFVRSELMDTVREYSNGESAYKYFTEQISVRGLYLLDEPENSLSPKRQLELLALIEDAAWYTGCQFVISTHSPFLMAIRGAKVYDLDEDPVTVKPWTELETVRTYYEFFQRYEREFNRR